MRKAKVEKPEVIQRAPAVLRLMRERRRTHLEAQQIALQDRRTVLVEQRTALNTRYGKRLLNGLRRTGRPPEDSVCGPAHVRFSDDLATATVTAICDVTVDKPATLISPALVRFAPMLGLGRSEDHRATVAVPPDLLAAMRRDDDKLLQEIRALDRQLNDIKNAVQATYQPNQQLAVSELSAKGRAALDLLLKECGDKLLAFADGT